MTMLRWPSFLRTPAALKRVAAGTLVCGALALAYALLAPSWYRSVLTVVPARQLRQGSNAAILGADLGGIASAFDQPLGGPGEPDRIAAVLQSNGVSDAVIEKFDLRQRYGHKYQEHARKELWEHCSVRTMPKPGMVELSCEDKDPRFAQQLLEYFASYGNQVFRRVGISSASEEVRFLENRRAELWKEADETAAQLRDFEEKYRIVDLDTQSKAVVSALAALNSQRISKELELDYMRTFSARGEMTARQLESQLSIVDDKLRDLEMPPPDGVEKRGRKPGTGSMFPAALAVPKLRADLEKMLRNRKVAETSLLLVLQRLETAKAAEARDVSTFLVLDPPALPTYPSRPRRGSLVVACTFLGLLLSSGREWWRARAETPPPPAAPVS